MKSIFNKVIIFVLTACCLLTCFTGCDSEIGEVVVNGKGAERFGIACSDEDITGYIESKKEEPIPVYTIKWGKDLDSVMPICGFIGPAEDVVFDGYKLPTTVTDEVYKKIADCGVNLITDQNVIYEKDREGTIKKLELAGKYGIKYFVKSTTAFKLEFYVDRANVGTVDDMKEIIQELSRYDAFAGLFGRDEPTTDMFGVMEDGFGNFYAAKEELGEEYDHLQFYFNLFPTTSASALSNGKDLSVTWEEYVDKYLNLTADKHSPTWFSFDMYPFVGQAGAYSTWFNHLETMNQKAKEYGVAWQGCVQAGYYGAFLEGQRDPTEGEMNWDVNTMIAFGAKGIDYYPLVMPLECLAKANLEEDVGKDALITKYGNTTKYYYYAQKINKQLHACEKVLMNAAQVGVIMNGQSPCKLSKTAALTSFRQLKKVSGDDAIVGCFDYKGGTALYVVNNSLSDSGKITLDFDGKYGYDVVQRGNVYSLVGSEFSLNLQAGESAFVVLR
ncbi:MAG: hypothetical protein IJQ66_00285 [Clostridia bacterium]|nr:hypothetical protein [Clostridia bacterium]